MVAERKSFGPETFGMGSSSCKQFATTKRYLNPNFLSTLFSIQARNVTKISNHPIHIECPRCRPRGFPNGRRRGDRDHNGNRRCRQAANRKRRGHRAGISVFNFTFTQNHTPAPLPLQAQIAMRAGGVWGIETAALSVQYGGAGTRRKGGALLDHPPHHTLKLHQNGAKGGGGVHF